MLTETNDYVMCMKCQATHHEDEDHECETPILSDALDQIKLSPGIDTPLLCLRLHEDDIDDPGYRGPNLATWLLQRHQIEWEDTCVAVDLLIEVGDISFSDDGELRANGY